MPWAKTKQVPKRGLPKSSRPYGPGVGTGQGTRAFYLPLFSNYSRCTLSTDLLRNQDHENLSARNNCNEAAQQHDFIVCGSGAAGSVVAARLAENPNVRVLLIEAGGSDDVPEVMTPGQWPLNLGSERDWGFVAQPNPNLNGRSIPLNMGKVVGGGSSINVLVWARGHKNDWEHFAEVSGDPAWRYDSVLEIYRLVEN